MSRLSIRNLNKIYDNKVEVLKNVNVEAEHGEFIVLVGPSGCGKSTLLRLIAGLEDITSGEILIGDRCVNDLPPSARDIAMVFQDYALYPHMSVKENLSFGLKIQKVPASEIEQRVGQASKMLNIAHLLDRKPAQLSGGQRQRVAIGRAIVRKPSIFLFDEPLSNLDAQLRAQTRIELASLHKDLGNTVVYVTHDQVEAMTLATRIVILNKGHIQQVGTPLEVYHRPANKFVASFIGNPSMNFLDGELEFSGNQKRFKTESVGLDLSGAPTPSTPGRYSLGLRPESLKVMSPELREDRQQPDLEISTVLTEPHGHETHLVAKLGSRQIILRTANPQRRRVIESTQVGRTLPTLIDRDALHWFEPVEDGKRVTVTVE